MKIHLSHPYYDNLEINLGQLTQIIGQNQQLKYYLWQLLIWYFDGKKYSEEDLSIFNQVEPLITKEDVPIKRNHFQIISIADIRDLSEQMIFKKGTASFDFLKNQLNRLDVAYDLETMNNYLEEIANHINNQLEIYFHEMKYHVEPNILTAEQLLNKYFSPYFEFQGKNLSFEYLDNKMKVMLFLKMLESNLSRKTENVLVIFKNLDDYLSHKQFIEICQFLNDICQKYSHFFCIVFPSNESYLYVTKENTEYINIISNQIESFYEFDFMYERFCQSYPTNDYPNEDQFLKLLQRNGSYLFSEEIGHFSLSVRDMVTIKILNMLYHFNDKVTFEIPHVNSMEIKYLINND